MASVGRKKKQQGAHLKESGAMMMSIPFLNTVAVGEDDPADQHIKQMTCDEMEKALYRQTRRPADLTQHSAREMLEENKHLVSEKQERKALARKNSRDFVEKLLSDDRMVNEADKAKDIGRRTAQRGLAQYYKAKIAEKEAEKSQAYQSKLDSGVAIQFFPFIEGETINQNRQAEASKMRDEMRGFLRKQREENPPRLDSLLADSNPDYHHRYPLMPAQSQSARGPAPRPQDEDPAAPGSGSLSARGSAVDTNGAPHLARHPRFLSRAREHMSRRIHDAHVRKALEDKVERTKCELEAQTRRRLREAQEWEDGMTVNDALRYDSTRVKGAERMKNAVYLKQQVEEHRDKLENDRQARRAEPAGYWGPEEKELRDPIVFREHCGHLINQMEVNQHRKIYSRSKRLEQEKTIIDNSVAEMSADREKERDKLAQHKEILTMTWDSQRKIRQVVKRIDAL